MKIRYTTYKILILFVLLVVSLGVKAQNRVETNPEIGGMISNQKSVWTGAILRATMQESRKLIHEDLKCNMIDFQKVENSMDKAEKAFQILDMILQSGVTALKVVRTTKDVKDTYSKTKDLMEKYVSQCLARKNVREEDTIFISTGKKMIDEVLKGINEITDMIGLTSAGGLIELVGTRQFMCSTEDVIAILDEIGDTCDRVSDEMYKSYYKLWQYMMLRMGYWKEEVISRRPTAVICQEAMERWLANSRARMSSR